MGFQNLHDTSGMEHNTKASKGANQRTNKTAAQANNTTKAQYERLSAGGKKEGE